MLENPLDATRRVVLRRASQRRGYHVLAMGEGWVFRFEGPAGRAVDTGVILDPAAVLDLRAEIDAAIAVAQAEGWEVDPAPDLRPVRPPRIRRELLRLFRRWELQRDFLKTKRKAGAWHHFIAADIGLPATNNFRLKAESDRWWSDVQKDVFRDAESMPDLKT